MRYLSAGSLRSSLAAIAGLVSATALAAPAPATDIPARQEVLTFPSLTLSDQQFLTGDQGGTEVLLGGVLSLPPGEGRVPVVILQHGSGGVGANITLLAAADQSGRHRHLCRGWLLGPEHHQHRHRPGSAGAAQLRPG